MQISIIIVSWNTCDLLKKCIKSILKYSQNIKYEIIVIDNASSDRTNKMMFDNFPNIKLIKNKKNEGFAKANNQGIKISKGEYVLLLNPDTEFIEDVLFSVFSKMKSDQKIGILGCCLLNSNKTLQPSVRRFPRLRDIFVILFKLNRLFPRLLDKYLAYDFNYLKEQEVDQVMGAFFLIRKEVFNRIGFLDEKYFIWFEEVDFCRRVIHNGWKVLYFPDVCIIHHQGQSFAQADTIKKQLWFFRSSLQYFFKGG